jgi:O-antigen biosynthesis protein WbqP
MLKRSFDFILSLLLLAIFSAPLLLVALLVRLTSQGSALHWSKRVGRNNEIFLMPKFRSMKMNTPQMATHLMTSPENFVTPVGKILRKTSLDELPQLISVLRGDMSFVGPRPALYNQHDLVALRTQHGLEKLRPGITGWAQVNGRDELPIPVKVEFDHFYEQHQSFYFDLKIIVMTFIKVFGAKGVSH